MWLVDHPVDDLPVLHTRSARHSPRYEGSWQLSLPIGEFITTYRDTMIHHLMIFEDGPWSNSSSNDRKPAPGLTTDLLSGILERAPAQGG
ncbi:hypothetical protein GCM10019016_105270 [Streptomyces prasinosporus]|uniref:Uncharacterized protein n=1 Tax=Streptomyces prasinosporus TaxID=68256 RepID=A0ABP6U768_9ACTN